VAPPGFCNTGEVRYGSIGGLQYEVPQSPLYCLCINVALCSTALQIVAMYLSCDTKKFHDNESTHILHNFWTSTRWGEASPLPPGGATGLLQPVIAKVHYFFPIHPVEVPSPCGRFSVGSSSATKPQPLVRFATGPILSVFPALIVHSKSVHPEFPVAFIF